MMSKIPTEVNDLIKSINKVSKIMSDDLNLIAEEGGEAIGLKILSADSDDKLIDKIMMIIKNGKALIELNKSAQDFEEQAEVKPKRNFESLIK